MARSIRTHCTDMTNLPHDAVPLHHRGRALGVGAPVSRQRKELFNDRVGRASWICGHSAVLKALRSGATDARI
jgi:hypothetical protein